MRRICAPFIAIWILQCFLIVQQAAIVEIHWGGDAEAIYDSGFMHRLMKIPKGGVSPFNMELIENDAPGFGYSEKGVSEDVVWGDSRARRILSVADPRAYKTWLVSFAYAENPQYPLQFDMNGFKGEFRMTNGETFR
ncbi:MAG: hypothetical protein ABIH23_19810 [bacterium]